MVHIRFGGYCKIRLANNVDALFSTELCGLLTSLEVVSPGYGIDIACVLAEKALQDMIERWRKLSGR
jgi:hypothetical protein